MNKVPPPPDYPAAGYAGNGPLITIAVIVTIVVGLTILKLSGVL